MHLSRAMNTPAVIAYSGEPDCFASYGDNINVFSETPCDICPSNKQFPMRYKCPLGHKCITGISPDKMIAAIREKLNAETKMVPQIIDCQPIAPVAGCESLALNRLGFG